MLLGCTHSTSNNSKNKGDGFSYSDDIYLL